jgi:hypothetical protein
MSESLNIMLEDARLVSASWFVTLETIIIIMSKSISKLREECKGKTGIVDHLHLKIADNWAKCAGCTVDLIEEDGNEYLTTRPDSGKTHIVHLENKRCSCACIDVCAVFRLKFEKSCDTVLDLCSTLYRWETIQKIFKLNIKPVPTETLARDGASMFSATSI